MARTDPWSSALAADTPTDVIMMPGAPRAQSPPVFFRVQSNPVQDQPKNGLDPLPPPAATVRQPCLDCQVHRSPEHSGAETQCDFVLQDHHRIAEDWAATWRSNRSSPPLFSFHPRTAQGSTAPRGPLSRCPVRATPTPGSRNGFPAQAMEPLRHSNICEPIPIHLLAVL